MNLFKSFFFVPANKPHFLEKSLKLTSIDSRVIDFEDSVSSSNLKSALDIVSVSQKLDDDYVRIPIDKEFVSIAKGLLSLGFNKVVLPKIVDKKHFEVVISKLLEIDPKVKIILLVENALIYLHLEEILERWNKHIHGIGLGSHDFSAVTKIHHNLKELFPLRLHVSLLANAYGVTPIDVASMNISDEKDYKAEIKSGYDLGYRAKFVLHPFQLQVLDNYPFYSQEEVQDALNVIQLFEEKRRVGEVVVKFKGKIFEEPHIGNLEDIISWGNKYYGTNR